MEPFLNPVGFRVGHQLAFAAGHLGSSALAGFRGIIFSHPPPIIPGFLSLDALELSLGVTVLGLRIGLSIRTYIERTSRDSPNKAVPRPMADKFDDHYRLSR